MRRWNGGAAATARLLLLLAAGAIILPAQTSTGQAAAPAQDPAPAAAAPAPVPQTPAAERKFERVDFGIRLRVFPSKDLSAMSNNSLKTTTTTPLYDWNFVTTSHSNAIGGGVALEIHLSRKTTFRAEALYNRLRYDKVTDIYWGGDDATTNNDERTHMNRVERTKARLLDVPLMVQFRSFGDEGLRSHMYVALGGVVRNVSVIRTTDETTFPDSSKTSAPGRVVPSKRNLLGATIGLGFHFTDDYGIKSTPEIRYTRWGGSTFASDSTQSPRNQLEFGIGFTF